MVRVRKYFLLILFTILFFVGKDNVLAVGAYIKDGDYNITCVYSNGMSITVTKTDIYLVQTTTSVGVDYSENTQLMLLESQRNHRDSDGKITSYNTGGFLQDYKCPKTLYGYFVEDGAWNEINTSLVTAPLLESADNYLYSTSDHVGTGETGKDGGWFRDGELVEREPDRDVYLYSESVDITTSKDVKICDYTSYINGNTETGTATLSLYLFDNIIFAALGDYITPLEYDDTSINRNECPNKDKTDVPIYINNPRPEAFNSNNSYMSTTQYKEIANYYMDPTKSKCDNKNDGSSCSAFEFLGERDPDSTDPNSELCEKLGDNLVTIIQEIVGIMQIVIPGLVIILTGVDIGRLVASGELDEELPKKKKTLAIRFVVMLIFFFLPQLTDLIIGLLKDADLIGVEYVECIFNTQ